MEEVVNLIMNTSTTIVVIAYFLYRDYKFMGTLQTTLQTLVDTVQCLKDTMKNEEETK